VETAQEEDMLNQLQWTPELVGKFWDAFSQSPLANLSFSRMNGASLLEVVAPYVGPQNRYLDFGAGDGDLIRLLIERDCCVAGYEPSEERRNKLSSQDFVKHANFLGIVSTDAEEVYDVVIAADVIEHFLDADMDAVTKRMRKFLRPGGIIIVSTPNNEDLDANSAYCPVSNLWFHRWQHVRSFTAESLNDLFGRLGFQRLHDHHVDFSSSANMIERLRKLKRKNRLRQRYDRLYSLLAKKKGKKKRENQNNLRIGNESHLIYIGRLG
jgi:2-polyprenyl-3-methyl-5-hydroxy-6-metoxy-1,4-benzoquinol methylase